MPIRQIPEPYDVDVTDAITRGELLYAATRGDRRAKATLKAMRTPRSPEESAAPTRRGSVKAGRLKYEGVGRQSPERSTDAD